jgi:creatinine amidohydrolase
VAEEILSARSTSAQVGNARPGFALLPIGSCEQHGSHLPLLTDWLVAATVAEGVCRQLGGLLLPALPYSSSIEHRGFPGTVFLRAHTLACLVRDVVESCRSFACPRVALLSGHGGNWILKPTVRELNADYPDMDILLVPESVLWGSAFGDDLHAGRIETSIMMHLAPESVGRVTQDHVPAVGREYLDYVPMSRVSSQGIWGYPSQGSREEGARIVQAMVDRVARYIAETFSRLDSLKRGTEEGEPQPDLA